MKETEVFPKTGKVIATLSLLFSLLAFLPSMAFSPAILISGLSFLGALMGALSGNIRVAVLTIYIVFATLIVSPISSSFTNNIDFRVLFFGLIIFGFTLAIFLLFNYKNHLASYDTL